MAGRIDGFKIILLSCFFHLAWGSHDIPSFADPSMKRDFGPWLQLEGYNRCPGALISINDEGVTMSVNRCGTLRGGPMSPKYKEAYSLDFIRFLWCSKEKCSDEYQRHHEGSYHRINGVGNTIEVQMYHTYYARDSRRRIKNAPDSSAVLVFFLQACLRCEKNADFEGIVSALTRLDDSIDRTKPGIGESFRIYDGNWGIFKQKFMPLGKKLLGPEVIPLLSVFRNFVSGYKSKIEMPFIHYKANFVDNHDKKRLSHWLVIPRALPISEQQAYSFALRSSSVPSFKHMGAETSPDGLTKDGYTLYTGYSAGKSLMPELQTARFE